MDRRTILFLHPHFLKPGGASRVVLEQASRLQQQGFRCPVITTRVSTAVVSAYPTLKIYSIYKYSTGQIIYWLTFPIFMVNLFRQVNKLKPDYIYCHSLAIYWGYFYKLIKRNLPVIYYLHDFGLPYTDLRIEVQSLPPLQRAAASISAPLLKYLNKSIFRMANYIVANSQCCYDYLEKHYNRKADEISSPGVDNSLFKPCKSKQDYIYTLGRLEKSKNIDKIIEGFAVFNKSNMKLKIIGEGIEKPRLEKLAADLGIKNQVEFLGRKETQEVAQIAACAKMGVFMGPYETFGMAAAECITCGTPIVGINVNGIQEIVNISQGGITTHAQAENIAQALAVPQENPRVKDMFGWEAQVIKLAEFFKRA